jgi:hypothetical protein
VICAVRFRALREEELRLRQLSSAPTRSISSAVTSSSAALVTRLVSAADTAGRNFVSVGVPFTFSAI